MKLRPGGDARERIVALTPAAKTIVPRLKRQWAATNAAADALDHELSMPLSTLLREAIEALERQPFGDRLAAITDARDFPTSLEKDASP